jgi:RNA polymerase sigma-70 factor (ECF subfamily)
MNRARRKQELYEQWVADHATELYRMAYRLAGSAAQAEDLTQETFYHAWRSFHTLKDAAKARAWLFQILRYRYSHWVRNRTRRPRTAPLDEKLTHPDQSGHQPIAMGGGESRSTLDRMADAELVQKALDTLDDRFRLPLVMVFMEGLTCRETAEQLDLPLGTVLSRLHRARQQIRDRMGEQFDEEEAPPQQPRTSRGDADDDRLRLRG